MSDGLDGPGDRPPATAPGGSSGGTPVGGLRGRGSDAPRAGRGAAHAATPSTEVGSRADGLVRGGLAATGLAVVLFLAATVPAFSAGLVVITFFGGRIVGLSVVGGTRAAVAPRTRALIAIALTLGALVAALAATWAFARLIGGVLDLPTYLLDTLGPVVPLSVAVGALGAWWGAD